MAQMTEQLELFARPDERRYATVECRDAKGNCWRHRVSDPWETCRRIECEMPDVKAEVVE